MHTLSTARRLPSRSIFSQMIRSGSPVSRLGCCAVELSIEVTWAAAAVASTAKELAATSLSIRSSNDSANGSTTPLSAGHRLAGNVERDSQPLPFGERPGAVPHVGREQRQTARFRLDHF